MRIEERAWDDAVVQRLADDQRAGYRAIGPFGDYADDPDAEHSLFFERTLP